MADDADNAGTAQCSSRHIALQGMVVRGFAERVGIRATEADSSNFVKSNVAYLAPKRY